MLRAAVVLRAICAAVVLTIGSAGWHAVANDDFHPSHPGYGSVHKLALPGPYRGAGLGPGGPLAYLGQKLFFDGSLSASGRTACASCHSPDFAYADPRRVSISDDGQRGRRNSPSLLNVGFVPKLMWDGKFGSLEQQAFGPFQSGEMGWGIDQATGRISADPQYAQLFQSAFGGFPTPDGIARALATYQRTLHTEVSRVDRFMAGRGRSILTSIERDGYAIFDGRAGCTRCHHPYPLGPGNSPPLFSDFRYHNLGVGYRSGGVPDAGRFELTRAKPELGAYRTPSLRSSVKAPPYMHDGSIATLEEVVEFYSAGGQPNPYISPLIRPLNLDGYEKAALVAFLRALGE